MDYTFVFYIKHKLHTFIFSIKFINTYLCKHMLFSNYFRTWHFRTTLNSRIIWHWKDYNKDKHKLLSAIKSNKSSLLNSKHIKIEIICMKCLDQYKKLLCRYYIPVWVSLSKTFISKSGVFSVFKVCRVLFAKSKLWIVPFWNSVQ